MQVKLNNVTKNFQNHSVFKGVNLDFNPGYRGVVLGGNGSGKSTLLKVISGAMVPSAGNVEYLQNGYSIPLEKVRRNVAFCGPYADLIEDFTLRELIQFHQSFRPFLMGISTDDIIDIVGLPKFTNRYIKTYSSGMKQRVRLAITILSDSPLLLLDEPTSNLDPEGKKWYGELIKNHLADRIVIVASNHLKDEYFFTTESIEMKNYQ